MLPALRSTSILSKAPPRYFGATHRSISCNDSKRPFLRLARALETDASCCVLGQLLTSKTHAGASAIDDTVAEGDPLCGSSALEAMYRIRRSFRKPQIVGEEHSAIHSSLKTLMEHQRTFLQQTATEAWCLQDSLQPVVLDSNNST